MFLKKYLLTALACLLLTGSMSAAEKTKKVYIYGVAISFNDSTVYITDIQELDSAAVTTRAKFLYGRDSYSYQLRDYLKAQGFSTPSCITSFALKQKDIEKKYIATKKRYGGGKFTVKHVTPDNFKYTTIEADADETATMTKAERKAAKQKAKADSKARAKAMKDNKKNGRQGGRPAPPHGNGERPMGPPPSM